MASMIGGIIAIPEAPAALGCDANCHSVLEEGSTIHLRS